MRAATAALSRTSSWSDPGTICASMISSACARQPGLHEQLPMSGQCWVRVSETENMVQVQTWLLPGDDCRTVGLCMCMQAIAPQLHVARAFSVQLCMARCLWGGQRQVTLQAPGHKLAVLPAAAGRVSQPDAWPGMGTSCMAWLKPRSARTRLGSGLAIAVGDLGGVQPVAQ